MKKYLSQRYIRITFFSSIQQLAPQKRNSFKQKKILATNSDRNPSQQVSPPLSPPLETFLPTQKQPKKHSRHAHRRHFRRSDVSSFISCMRHRFSPQGMGLSPPGSRLSLASPVRRRADRFPLDDSYSFTPSPLSMFRPHKDKTSSFMDSLRLCVSDDYLGDEERVDDDAPNDLFDDSPVGRSARDFERGESRAQAILA